MNECSQPAMLRPLGDVVESVMAILRYAHTRAPMMANTADLEAMVERNFTQMMHHVRASALSVTHETATKLHDMLDHAGPPFDTSHVVRMGRLTDELLQSNSSARPTGSMSQQSHLYIHRYLGAAMWQHLQGEMSIDHKMEILCRFFVNNLLLRNPDELTRRHALALVYVSSAIDINAQEAFEHVVRMRELMVHTRQLNHNGIKGPKTYAELPDDQLHVIHPHTTTWHGDDAPVPCPIDELRLRFVERLIPIRQSHRHAKSTKSPHGSPMKDAPTTDVESFDTDTVTRYIKHGGVPVWLGRPPKHEADARGDASSHPSRALAPHVLAAVPLQLPPTPGGIGRSASTSSTESHRSGASILSAPPAETPPAAPLAPPAETPPAVNGDIEQLRTSIMGRFTRGLPSKRVSSTPATGLHCAVPLRRLRCKTSLDPMAQSMMKAAMMVAKRPAASDIDSCARIIGADPHNVGWVRREYVRKSGKSMGNTYSIYQDPSGRKYASMKQAQLNGYICVVS